MTDQANNDSGSRRLRREEERRRQLDELVPRRPIEVPPVERIPIERSAFDPAPAERSPIERGWRDDLAPEAGRLQERQLDPAAPAAPATPVLSRRALRERTAGGADPAAGAPQPSVDETWGARRAPEPEPSRPDPTPPERPLSRRELRERAEVAAGAPAGPRSDDASPVEALPGRREAARRESPQYEEPAGRRSSRRAASDLESRQHDPGQYDAPRPDAGQYDAPRHGALRQDAPQPDAPGVGTPDAGRAPSAGGEDPDVPIIRRDREEWSRREPVPNPADLETSGPARPAQPTRASTGESSSVQDETPVRAREPEQVRPDADPVADAPVRVSPQARAAAIRAQAARLQEEQEAATRERYEQLQSRASRGAQPESQSPTAPPPAAMWGQRTESNGAGQPSTESEAASGYADRPAVRRVVLPPSMSAGTGPADVPVLGQWQAQPQPQPQAQPQPAAQPPQQQFPGVSPQQYQGVPQGGPMPANGQPFATVTMAPSDRGATQTATAPARPATGGPGGPPNMDGSGPLPRWGSVGASWSPPPSGGPNGQSPVAPVSPAPAVLNGARRDQDHDHDDDDHDETAHRQIGRASCRGSV